MRRTTRLLGARSPLRPFLIERYPGWNDSSMSLSSSECEPLTLPELLSYADEESLHRWNNLSLGYSTPSEGSCYLREKIIEVNYDKVSPMQTNVCAPQEGISLAMQTLLSAEDHVVATVPCYQSLTEVARSIGCNVTPWTPKIRTNTNTHLKEYYFDPEDLRSLLREKTTLITNFPHNPTGALPTLQEFKAIIEICEENNSWLFNDEMYRDLEHNPLNRLPSVADTYDKGIALSGLSKSYGLPGLRIGWLACRDDSVMSRVAELKDYMSICPPVPSECLAYIALNAKAQILKQNHELVIDGLEKLRHFVTSHSQFMEWHEPLGGTFSLVTIIPQSENDEFYSAELYSSAMRARTGLMVIPSSLFPGCDDSKLRLTYGRRNMSTMLHEWHLDLTRQK